MSRDLQAVVETVGGNHVSVIELKWDKLESLNNCRNKFGQSYGEIMYKLEQRYQPFCLKDYFLYSCDKKMLALLSSLDGRLNNMEIILKKSQPEWEKNFESEQSSFKKLLDEADIFLKDLSTTKTDHSGFRYFKIARDFECEIQAKKNFTGYDAALNQLNKFTVKVDEYRLYFNTYHLMPESLKIRALLAEIKEKSQLEDDLDPKYLDLLQQQLRENIKVLEEAIHRVKHECIAERVALEKAMSNLHLSLPPLPPEMPARFFSHSTRRAQSGCSPDDIDDDDEWVNFAFSSYW